MVWSRSRCTPGCDDEVSPASQGTSRDEKETMFRSEAKIRGCIPYFALDSICSGKFIDASDHGEKRPLANWEVER